MAFDPDPAPEAPEQDGDDGDDEGGEGLGAVVAQGIEDVEVEGDEAAQVGDGGGGIELSGRWLAAGGRGLAGGRWRRAGWWFVGHGTALHHGGEFRCGDASRAGTCGNAALSDSRRNRYGWRLATPATADWPMGPWRS